MLVVERGRICAPRRITSWSERGVVELQRGGYVRRSKPAPSISDVPDDEQQCSRDVVAPAPDGGGEDGDESRTGIESA